jgi:hypothetical protein
VLDVNDCFQSEIRHQGFLRRRPPESRDRSKLFSELELGSAPLLRINGRLGAGGLAPTPLGGCPIPWNGLVTRPGSRIVIHL